jgi:hypothetical protein
MKNNDELQDRSVAKVSGALLLAHIVTSFAIFRFYQIDAAYRVLTFVNQALIAVSLCVGAVLVFRETRKGRPGNALWPAILLSAIGGELALLILGDMVLPQSS